VELSRAGAWCTWLALGDDECVPRPMGKNMLSVEYVLALEQFRGIRRSKFASRRGRRRG
jgi:hypothetical protein